MKSEADFKSIIKKSVKTFGGHSISIAAPMFAGVPDLYVILPGYIPVLLEAKWLGKITREKFSRKVPFTEMQINWIKCCHEVNNFSAMGLIGFIYKDEVYAALVAHGTPQFYTFSNSFLTDCSFVKYTPYERTVSMKRFNMQELFAGVPIPKIAVQPKPKGIFGELGTYSDPMAF